MSLANEQEIEVKFWVADLAALEQRLQAAGARLVQPRVHEVNWRYDTPAGDLARAKQVLRARQDTQAVLTYKGPDQARGDVSARQEIEFTVSDLTAARHFLEALGYTVSLIYEKYRAIWELNSLHVTLDEMPFGSLAEIEGPDAASIQAAAEGLGLSWPTRVMDSYTGMFARLKQQRSLTFRDLTFENFQGMDITAAELGHQLADRTAAS